MFEWLKKFRRLRPDWVISIPDGYAATASVSYKGQEVPVRRFMLELEVGSAAVLHLELYSRSLEAVLKLLDEEPVTVIVTEAQHDH